MKRIVDAAGKVQYDARLTDPAWQFMYVHLRERLEGDGPLSLTAVEVTVLRGVLDLHLSTLFEPAYEQMYEHVKRLNTVLIDFIDSRQNGRTDDVYGESLVQRAYELLHTMPLPVEDLSCEP
jgi:hypothetical protein